MSIQIKITLNQLSYINDCFAELERPKLGTRDSRVAENILQNLYKKLLKKTISKIGTTDKFKLSLEYYEAHFLEQYLLHCLKQIFKSGHAYNSLQSIVNELNQQLA